MKNRIIDLIFKNSVTTSTLCLSYYSFLTNKPWHIILLPSLILVTKKTSILNIDVENKILGRIFLTINILMLLVTVIFAIIRFKW